MITKDELAALAEVRTVEAEALAQAGFYSGAYYLLGYAVECALKALIATEFKASTIPYPKEVTSIFTHRISVLSERAGLARDILARAKADPEFDIAWTAIQQWDSESRYMMRTENDYAVLARAVLDPSSGFLQWIRTLL